jgi:hypothetical protein
MLRSTAWIAFASLLVVGCGTVERIEPPQIDPVAAGTAAVKEYDRDGDGKISREESQGTGLADEVFGRHDADGDGHLTDQEIAGRLQSMLDKKIGLVPAWCEVYWNGEPLKGAEVVLVPETFLEGMVGEARGVTGGRGVAYLDSTALEAGESLPGAPPGIYRVRITHQEIDLPARYNSSTTLGMEVAPMERGADSKVFRLERG